MFDFFSRKKTENSDVTPNHSKVQTNYNDASALEAYFKQETGVTFEKQRNILKSKLTSFCTVRQIYSFDECLNRCNGKVSGNGGAAHILNLKPKTLESKMRKLGIHRHWR